MESFRAHSNVIGALLRSWEGPKGIMRWSYNNWECFLDSEQILDYRMRFGVDPTDGESGIRVYFDDWGYLHIDNCRDSDLKVFLENRMAGWYHWAREEYRRRQGYPAMNVLELIDPYTKVLKPGFYQARYRNLVFNFDEEMRFMFSETYLPFDHHSCRWYVNTGFTGLDGILRAVITDDDPISPGADGFRALFGLLGRFRVGFMFMRFAHSPQEFDASFHIGVLYRSWGIRMAYRVADVCWKCFVRGSSIFVVLGHAGVVQSAVCYEFITSVDGIFII